MIRASAGPLFMVWRRDLGIFCTGPHPPRFTADLHCYYSKLQTPNPAVSQHSSRKCVYGLLTSRESFPSLVVSFHFQVSAQVNRVIHAPAICRDGHAASMASAKTTFDTEVWYNRREGEEKRDNSRNTAPCWLRCTGRRTSVFLIGLHTLLEQSSVCSHARPELRGKQSYFNKTASSVSKNGCSFVNDATGWIPVSAVWFKFPLSLDSIVVN